MTGKKSSWRGVLGWSVFIIAIVAVIYSFRPNVNDGSVTRPQDRDSEIQFSAYTLDGNPWRLSAYRGQVVVMNIFATWCPPCRHETPDLVDLSHKFADDGVVFVGVSVDQGGEQVLKPFVKQYNIPYPIAMPSMTDPLIAPIQAIPVTLLIDRQGRVAKNYVGAITAAGLAADIREVLAEKDHPADAKVVASVSDIVK